MRHNMSKRKLGRTSEHRRALFRNQLKSLITHERIITTLPKAKELRPIAEKVVKLGPRRGDGAELAILEFVDFKLGEGKAKAEGEAKKERKKKAPAAARAEAAGPGK